MNLLFEVYYYNEQQVHIDATNSDIDKCQTEQVLVNVPFVHRLEDLHQLEIDITEEQEQYLVEEMLKKLPHVKEIDCFICVTNASTI